MVESMHDREATVLEAVRAAIDDVGLFHRHWEYGGDAMVIRISCLRCGTGGQALAKISDGGAGACSMWRAARLRRAAAGWHRAPVLANFTSAAHEQATD
jgi:hypothetical protein